MASLPHVCQPPATSQATSFLLFLSDCFCWCFLYVVLNSEYADSINKSSQLERGVHSHLAPLQPAPPGGGTLW